jgi:hypothetical protein
LLLLLLRAGTSSVAFLVADGAALWLSHSRGSAENGGQLGVNCLAFGDEVFNVRDLGIDIQFNHLLSSAVMRLKVPVVRCHGSVASCGSVPAFKSGSIGAMVLNRNWVG